MHRFICYEFHSVTVYVYVPLPAYDNVLDSISSNWRDDHVADENAVDCQFWSDHFYLIHIFFLLLERVQKTFAPDSGVESGRKLESTRSVDISVVCI